MFWVYMILFLSSDNMDSLPKCQEILYGIRDVRGPLKGSCYIMVWNFEWNIGLGFWNMTARQECKIEQTSPLSSA